MTPDDLVERVARVMAVAEGFDPDLIINNDTPDCPQPLWRLYRRSAPAAIAVCMEEAAKVADGVGQQPPTDNLMHDTGWDGASLVIAAAIRAMIKEPQR